MFSIRILYQIEGAPCRKNDLCVSEGRDGDEGHRGVVEFTPYHPPHRRSGTGCVSQLNGQLWEGRYSPKWIDGKKYARNIYAHTREECEAKLAALIVQMKKELAELKAEGTPFRH